RRGGLVRPPPFSDIVLGTHLVPIGLSVRDACVRERACVSSHGGVSRQLVGGRSSIDVIIHDRRTAIIARRIPGQGDGPVAPHRVQVLGRTRNGRRRRRRRGRRPSRRRGHLVRGPALTK